MSGLGGLAAAILLSVGGPALAAPAPTAETPRAPSLQEKFRRQFLVGVALEGNPATDYAPAERALVRTQFGAVTPANCLKIAAVQPEEERFEFGTADALVAFAATNGLKACGHCLVWAKDERTPAWVFRDGTNVVSRDLLLRRLQTHIQTVAGRYRGSLASWDVVNEALDDGDDYLRPSKWSSILGEDFTAKAFEFAHAADPGAVLVYNDYNVELPAKRAKLFRLLRALQEKKAPIHAVGIQGHWELDAVPFDDIEETINGIQKLGLKVIITELDLDVIPRARWWADNNKYRDELSRYNPYTNGCPADLLQRQAAQYRKLFALFARHSDAIARVSFWGLHDGRSWLNYFPWHRTNHPLLFDREARPKPAYRAVLDLPLREYRNLFAEAGHTGAEIRTRIDTAWTRLFHGDPASQAVYFAAGTNANGPLAYIRDVANNDVRSEGMSYGMMIAVQTGHKAEFDALWNWSKTFMFHSLPTHPARGYFSWSMKPNGQPNDEMPAPDGEEYFVTALCFAANRWDSGAGIYDYRAEADRLLKDLRHRQLITGPTVKGTMTAGAIFEPDRKMVRFTPDVVNWAHTDPSYHLPAFYELWAQWGPPEDRPFWAEAAAVSRDFFQRAAHPATGLAPDYANFDGSPWSSWWNPHSSDFQYDSWRTAMNWSVDWAWWGKDQRERQLSDRIQAFFESKGMQNYGHRFTLDGKQFGNEHAPGLVAMNATASLAAIHPRAKQFVEAFWKTPIPDGPGRYYGGMLYLLALLHCSGEFRIWDPP